MKKLLMVLLFPLCSSAQVVTTLSKNSSFYKKNYQFSSIVIYGEKILLPTERCGMLEMITLNGDFESEKKLSVPINAQIEGAALYGDFLLLLDEKKDKPAIYTYDLKNSKIIDTDTLKEYSYKDDKYGVEGIAVNADKKVCYILQERTEEENKRQSIIRQYKIVENNGKLEFVYQSGIDIVIIHPEFSIQLGQRYADLFYDDKKLYLLGSYFEKRVNWPNQYFIDVITDMDDAGFIKKAADLKSENLVYVDISKRVLTFLHEQYSTNFEGMTFHKGEIFLVTDNAMKDDTDCTKDAALKTLLVKFKKPAW